MNTIRRISLLGHARGTAEPIIFAICLHVAASAQAGTTLLYEFSGADGSWPNAVALVDQTLYGTAQRGGASDNGTIFSLQTDGTGFHRLHDFGGAPADGRQPSGSLIVDGSTLYSTTAYGGYYNRGTVFSIGRDGTGIELLAEFTQRTAYPNAGPTLVDGKLYGTTVFSDLTSGFGSTIYRLNTDGSNLEFSHTFPSKLSPDGNLVYAGVVQAEGKLFGAARTGGSSNLGTIFSVNADGSDFQLLHNFAPGALEGAFPMASLTVVGSTLYGTATDGGGTLDGTIFKINTDGSGFQVLHEFAGGAADGSEPRAALTQVGNALYGTTRFGGDFDRGTIFKMNLDGTGYAVLHEFAGGATDGSEPWAALTLDGSTLYGTTRLGGSADQGTVFAFVIPEPSTYIMALVAVLTLAAWRSSGRRF